MSQLIDNATRGACGGVLSCERRPARHEPGEALGGQRRTPSEVPAGPPRRTHSGPSVAAAAFAVLVGAVAASLGLIVPSHFTLRGIVLGGIVGAVFFVGGIIHLIDWADEEVGP